jgi:hypothetical protein
MSEWHVTLAMLAEAKRRGLLAIPRSTDAQAIRLTPAEFFAALDAVLAACAPHVDPATLEQIAAEALERIAATLTEV